MSPTVALKRSEFYSLLLYIHPLPHSCFLLPLSIQHFFISPSMYPPSFFSFSLPFATHSALTFIICKCVESLLVTYMPNKKEVQRKPPSRRFDICISSTVRTVAEGKLVAERSVPGRCVWMPRQRPSYRESYSQSVTSVDLTSKR